MPIDPRMVKWEESTPDDIRTMVTAEAERQGVPVDLALSLMRAESAGRQNAVSPKGAIGPMQLMPATAKELGVDPTDPVQNVRGGITYLKQQLERFGRPELAVAAYNAGPGAVTRAGGVPNIPETQAYVPKVMAGASNKPAIDPRMVKWEDAPAPAPAPQAAPGVSSWDSFTRGLRDPLDKFTQLAARGLNVVGMEGDYLVKNVDTDVAKRLREYEAARGKGAGTDWLRMGGNVVATAPLAALVPGAAAPSLLARTASSAAAGGGLGALQPVDTSRGDFWSETGKEALGGAIGGAAAAPIATAAGRVLAPKTSDSVRQLMREGVTPTPGQILGGGFKSTEERLASTPILGSGIRSGQQRAVEEFDRAAANRALFDIGEKLPKNVQGRDAVVYIKDKLQSKYNDVLTRVGAPAVDNRMLSELSNLSSLLQNQPKDLAQRLDTIIGNEILARTQYGTIPGEAIKKAEENLDKLGRNLLRDQDSDKRVLGSAVMEAQNIVRDWLERAAPANVADELKRVNRGWANFKRVERAAGYLGAEDGVFSPAQLHGAVKALDRSKDKSAFAAGRAMMQDLSEAGKEVLGNKVPNSGTPERAMVGYLAASAMNPLKWPGMIAQGAGAGIASLPYTGLGQSASAAMLARRPDVVRALGDRLPLLTPGLTAALAPAGYGLLGQ